MVKIFDLTLGPSLADPAKDWQDLWHVSDAPDQLDTFRYTLQDAIHGYALVTGPDSASGKTSIFGTIPAVGTANDLVLLTRIGDTWDFAKADTVANSEYYPARKVSTDQFRFLPFGEALRAIAHPFSSGNALGFDEADTNLFLQNDGSLANTQGSATLKIIACRPTTGNDLAFFQRDGSGGTGGGSIGGSIAAGQVAVGTDVDIIGGFAGFTFVAGNLTVATVNLVDPFATDAALTAHIANLAPHRLINDTGTLITDLFSAAEIITRLGLKTDGTDFTTHTGNDAIHRLINDLGGSVFDLFSASEIISRLALKTDSTTFSAHAGSLGIHRVINDEGTATTELRSAANVAAIDASVTAVASDLNTHIIDVIPHRVINDTGTSNVDLLSAEKIRLHTENAAFHFIIDDTNIALDETNSSSFINDHFSDATKHRIINDLGLSTTETFSAFFTNQRLIAIDKLTGAGDILTNDGTDNIGIGLGNEDQYLAAKPSGAANEKLVWTNIPSTPESGYGTLQGHFQYSNTITEADPGTGFVRFDSLTPASITKAFISKTGSDGHDNEFIFEKLSLGSIAKFQQITGNKFERYVSFDVDSIPVDNTTWFSLPVTFRDGALLPELNAVIGANSNFSTGAGGIPDTLTTDADILSHNGSTYFRVPIGADGQVLVARPGGGTGLKLVYENQAPTGGTPITLTTDGDILSHDGTTHIRIPLGADGTQLIARPGAGVGMKLAYEATELGAILGFDGAGVAINLSVGDNESDRRDAFETLVGIVNATDGARVVFPAGIPFVVDDTTPFTANEFVIDFNWCVFKNQFDGSTAPLSANHVLKFTGKRTYVENLELFSDATDSFSNCDGLVIDTTTEDCIFTSLRFTGTASTTAGAHMVRVLGRRNLVSHFTSHSHQGSIRIDGTDNTLAHGRMWDWNNLKVSGHGITSNSTVPDCNITLIDLELTLNDEPFGGSVNGVGMINMSVHPNDQSVRGGRLTVRDVTCRRVQPNNATNSRSIFKTQAFREIVFDGYKQFFGADGTPVAPGAEMNAITFEFASLTGSPGGRYVGGPYQVETIRIANSTINSRIAASVFRIGSISLESTTFAAINSFTTTAAFDRFEADRISIKDSVFNLKDGTAVLAPKNALRSMVLTDVVGTFVLGEEIEDDSDASIDGIVNRIEGTGANITLHYLIIDSGEFSASSGTFTGSISGATATAVDAVRGPGIQMSFENTEFTGEDLRLIDPNDSIDASDLIINNCPLNTNGATGQQWVADLQISIFIEGKVEGSNYLYNRTTLPPLEDTDLVTLSAPAQTIDDSITSTPFTPRWYWTDDPPNPGFWTEFQFGTSTGSMFNPSIANLDMSGFDIFGIKNLTVSDSTPIFTFGEVDAPLDEKFSQWTSIGGQLRLVALDDGAINPVEIIEINRTGTTINEFKLFGDVTIPRIGVPDTGAPIEISSGVLTTTGSNARVDSEGASGPDDIDTITAGYDGQLLYLWSTSAARPITIKHATGNVRLTRNSDFTFVNAEHPVLLQFQAHLGSGEWHDVSGIRADVTPQDFGAVGDGVADDTIPLQSWADSGSDNLVLRGTYVTNEAVNFISKTNFRIIGDGATIKAKDAMAVASGKFILSFEKCEDFRVEGVTLDANRANRDEAEVTAHTLRLRGCKRFTFENTKCLNGVTDGILIQAFIQEDSVTFAFDPTPANNVFTKASHGFVNGDRLFVAGTAVPTNYDDATRYFVVNVQGSDDFSLSLTLGGPAVVGADAGTAVTVKQETVSETGTLLNCKSDNNFRQGMSVINCYDLNVIGGEYTNSNGTDPQAGIDIESNVTTLLDGSPANLNINIRGARISGNTGPGIINSGQLNEGVVIDGCIIHDNLNGAVVLSSKATVINNDITGDATALPRSMVDCGSNAFVNDTIIANNRFHNIPTAIPCIYSHATASRVQAHNNVFENVTQVYQMNAPQSTFVDNIIKTTTTSPCIAPNSEGGIISNNTFEDCAGLIMQSAQDCVVSNNLIKDQATNNHWFRQTQNECLLTDNIVLQTIHAATFVFDPTPANNIFTSTVHGFENGERLLVGGTPPTGYNTTTGYHIVNKTNDTLSLSLTAGGDPVVGTDAGTSVTLRLRLSLAAVKCDSPATIKAEGNSFKPYSHTGFWLVDSGGLVYGSDFDSPSVKDYGAIGDGVADDSAAIQAAIDEGAGDILLPAGTYLCNSSLDIGLGGFVMRGVSSDKATILSGVIGDSLIKSTAASLIAFHLQDVTLQGNDTTGAGGTGHAINFIDPIIGSGTHLPQHCSVERVVILDFKGNDVQDNAASAILACGIIQHDGLQNIYRDVRISNCGIGAAMFLTENTKLDNCTIQGCTQFGLVAWANETLIITKCDILQNGDGTQLTPLPATIESANIAVLGDDGFVLRDSKVKNTSAEFLIWIKASKLPLINACWIRPSNTADQANKGIYAERCQGLNITENTLTAATGGFPATAKHQHIELFHDQDDDAFAANIDKNIFINANNSTTEFFIKVGGDNITRNFSNVSIKDNVFGNPASLGLASLVDDCILIDTCKHYCSSISDNLFEASTNTTFTNGIRFDTVDDQQSERVRNCFQEDGGTITNEYVGTSPTDGATVASANDTTPDVLGADFLDTSANTGTPTKITTLPDLAAGQSVTIFTDSNDTAIVQAGAFTYIANGFWISGPDGGSITIRNDGTIATPILVEISRSPNTDKINVAAASPKVDLAEVGNSGSLIHITGSGETIEDFGIRPAGTKFTVVLDGSNGIDLTVSALTGPTELLIEGLAGDTFELWSEGSGSWTLTDYTRKDGTALVAGGEPGTASLAAATAIALDGTAINSLVDITGFSVTINTMGDAPAGSPRTLKIISGSITFTNSANIVIPGGSDYVAAGGDIIDWRALAGDAWVMAGLLKNVTP